MYRFNSDDTSIILILYVEVVSILFLYLIYVSYH